MKALLQDAHGLSLEKMAYFTIVRVATPSVSHLLACVVIKEQESTKMTI